MTESVLSPAEMTALRYALLSHVGKENAIKAVDLCKEIGYPERLPNIATAVRSIVRNQRIPIATCHKGFFIAVRRSEIAEYKAARFQQAQSLMESANDTEIAFNYWNN